MLSDSPVDSANFRIELVGFSLEQLWHWFILSWPLRCWSYFQFYGMADCSVAAGMCPQNPSTTKSSGYSITSFRTLLQIVPSAEIQQLKFSVRPQRPRSSLALALLLWIPPFIITVILHYSLVPALCHSQKSTFISTALRWELHPQPAPVELQETRNGWTHPGPRARGVREGLSVTHTGLNHILGNF